MATSANVAGEAARTGAGKAGGPTNELAAADAGTEVAAAEAVAVERRVWQGGIVLSKCSSRVLWER